MRYRMTFPIIYSADVSAALAFYRDGLGMRETLRFPDGSAEPEFVSLSLDDSTGVALSGPGDSIHGRPVQPGARGFELCIYADDVDAAAADLRARGHAVLVDPVDQPWGERMAYIADPDGNPVMICAPLTADTGSSSAAGQESPKP
jgi:lactoylglutathione lyase